jgi:hypothetical protein
MEVNGRLHDPAALLPRKEPQVHIGYEAGLAPEPVWTLWSREESVAPTGNRILAVHPVDRRYKD